MNLREKLLAGGKVPTGEVVVSLDGEPMTVQVRGLTQAARGRLMESSMRTVVDDDGEKSQEMDMVKMQPSLIIECSFDPATGERLFTEADREEISGLAAAYLDPIIEMASKLSGLGKDAVKEAKGN